MPRTGTRNPGPARPEGAIGLSCYFRHMKEVFAEAGVDPTPENRAEIDRAVHEIVGVPYKNCPAAWRGVKAALADGRARRRFLQALEEKAGGS